MTWYSRSRKFVRKYPNKSLFALFIAIGLAASYVFYLRFPNNFIEPNFYAEDGSVFLHNIEQLGFFKALFTTFNGYFISGLYLIEGAGYGVNMILFGGSFLDLPRSFSIVSYLFLGFVCALPVLLFRNYFKLPALLLIVALSVFIPLPGYDYAIIGTIGNLKFIFVYIAFLLLVYRHLIPAKNWKRFIIIDTLLLLCAYTNVVVYLLLPFALLRYLPHLRFNKNEFLKLFHERSFQSLVALGFLLLPQLVIIKMFGIPTIPGYLDTPYQSEATINIFIYRTYLFPFLPALTSYLNNILVVITFILLNVVLWFGIQRYRAIYGFGMISAFLITLLFVLNRPGVSELFKAYLSSGPDQFFYTQNLIVCFLVGIATVALLQLINQQRLRFAAYILATLAIIVLYIPVAGSYGKHDFMQRTVKNIYINAQQECNSHTGTPDLQLYPVTSDDFPLRDIARDRVCTPATLSYVPDTEYFSFDSLSGTYIADIVPANISQTFRANYDDLSGISVMFLTYKQTIKDRYVADVLTGDCRTKLRSAEITPDSIDDAAYARINFDKIEDSDDKIYCLKFYVREPKTAALALALSKENLYPEGQLTTNESPRTDDLMLRLHYSQ